MDALYRESYANIHRGVYTIAEEATAAYERARAKVARFLGAPTANEVVFTKNITEAINLVAYTWGRANLREGDAIVLTEMEHHANIVPWHILAPERGVELRWIPIDRRLPPRPQRPRPAARRRASSSPSPRCRTCSARSTTCGRLADAAHAAGALVLVDAAQAVPHMRRRRAGLGRRLRRLHRPQDARPDRHRRALGAAPSCSRRCRRSSAAAR